MALTDYLLHRSVQLFFSKYKNCLCVSTHFICFQALNMILVKISSFSIAEYFINVNISYRFLSLLVITGVFVFTVLKGNTCFCQFCSHHLSVAAIKDYFILPRYCIFFSDLFILVLQKVSGWNPGPWTLLSTFWWKAFSLSFISLPEFTLPQV